MEIRNQRSKAVAAFEAFFADADNKLSPDAQSLTDKDITRLVHELR